MPGWSALDDAALREMMRELAAGAALGGVRADERRRLRLRARRCRALPRQLLRTGERRGGRVPDHPREDRVARGADAPGRDREARPTSRRGSSWSTGPTGSGKSTTLAAVIDHINRTYARHIVTIEDPVEFVHQNKQSVLSHREVGADTDGLRRRRCAPPCARTPTSCSSARCATGRPSPPPSPPPRWACSSSARSTRTALPRPSTASSTCSRRTSSRRSGSASPSPSPRSSHSSCSRRPTARAASPSTRSCCGPRASRT